MKQLNRVAITKIILGVGIVFFMVFGAVLVQGAVIEVTTTQDHVVGSLRAAITAANSNNENDTIHLPAGTYILVGQADENGNAGGDLDINNTLSITIIGESAEKTFIDGNGNDRILHILRGTVSISNVTIQNGKTSDGGTYYDLNGADGGGIYNNGTLSLTNCSIDNNKCGRGYEGYYHIAGFGCPGGGGHGGGIYNSGSLTLTGCTIANNSAGDCGGAFYCCSVPSGGHGGAIYNSSTGSQVLNNCAIRNNKSGNGFERMLDEDVNNNGGEGGGIFNEGSQELINCSITFNRTGRGNSFCGGSEEGRCGHGAGIYNSGVSTIEKSIINNNTNGVSDSGSEIRFNGNGAGIYNSGEFTIIDSSINNNNTSQGGSGGGIFHHLGTLTLIRCSITNNKTGNGMEYYNPNGGSGGGIYNEDILSLINCTVSGNNTGNGSSSEYRNGGNGGDGGGICNFGTLNLKNSTIVNNTTGSGGSGGNDPGDEDGRFGFGGGIYNPEPTGIVNIKNTIVANNQVKTGGEGADAWGTLNSQGYNLVKNTNYCFITGVLIGNITSVDPLLGPLADNGGPTQTHALLTGSPAIDAGNSKGIPLDQRGVSRPVDIPGIINVSDGADIGAYEYECFITISGTITYGETGLPGVTLTFSNNGGATATDKQGNYSHAVPTGWSGTVTPSCTGFYFSPADRNYTSINTDKTNQDFIAIPAVPPRISLNRTRLNFGAAASGCQTGAQPLLINNSGAGILTWAVSVNAYWLNCTPTSGTGSAVVTVSINPLSLMPGTYTAAISIEDPNAANSPQIIQVTLILYDTSSIHSPLGTFETPIDGSTVRSSVPVTGWVIDNIGIEYVKIFRKAVAGEGSGLVYIGDAVLVEGARPDVEAAYPGYPENYKAGWGYMLLTNMLPNQGNGTFTLYAKTADKEGNVLTLGTKTIKGDNAHAVKPFGAIDTPTQGGTASGSNYVNFGWALTPLPNTIPIDGSTIKVWVDGIPLGHPVYNRYRKDIAALFPGYNNSAGAVGYYYLDTGKYENGVHTIAWSVTDDAGNTDGIGSRYFTIQNTSTSASDRSLAVSGLQWLNANVNSDRIPGEDVQTLRIRKGYNLNIEPDFIYPDDSGNMTIEIKELERLEIHLYESTMNIEPGTLNVIPLPIGAALDHERGIFAWQPGPGYLGDYELAVVGKTRTGEIMRKFINIRIRPKFDKKYQK
jgi:hypothetical protein